MNAHSCFTGCVLLTAATAIAGVVAVNDAVPYPQLRDPAGTSEDPTVFKYDAYTKDFGTLQGLDIGTYNPFIQLHVVNQSKITSSKIWFVGGDYPNKSWESQRPEDYPGSQTLLIDNSSMSTGELRVGSKNSNNTLLLRDHASLSVGLGLYINRHEGVINSNGVSGNAVRVTGGSTLAVTGGDLFVGYGDSSNESLIVTEASTVTIGDDTTSRRLRMRFSHESLVRVAGAGSKLFVTGSMSLGESNTLCHSNRLILEDSGELWIRNAAGGAPLSSTFVAGKEANKIMLANGSLVVHGDQTGNNTLANMIWVSDGKEYLDGTLGNIVEAGKFSATYHEEGKYAGFTVFTGGVVPEPSAISAGFFPLALAGRRRR
jgi:hypothetical protein